MSVYGIDLGTTYSCLSKILDNGTVEVIRNQGDQKATLASAVYYDTDGDYIVGDAAKEAVQDAPERLCQFFKRYIGRPELLQKEHEENPDLYVVDGIERDPVELSSIVLKKIKAYAADQGEDVSNAVITCPAYFNQSQREATELAAQNAGINVLAIINEPTAAVMNYAMQQGVAGIGASTNVLVYDLGGGTFDITLVQLSKKEDGGLKVQVLASVGDDVLGGKDWDQALENLVKSKLAAELGCAEEDISQDVTFAIRSQVEKNKQALTEKSSVTFKFTDDDGNRQKIAVTREEFDEATSTLLGKTMPLVQSVLRDKTPAKPEPMSPDQVDVVLLVGGSTLMPQVKTALSTLFDESKIVLSDPHQAVAKGAAIVAKDIQDGIDAELLTELKQQIEKGEVEIKDGKVVNPITGEVDTTRTEKLNELTTQKPATPDQEPGAPEPQITEDTINEMLVAKTAESQSKLELMDVSPTTFGVVLLVGFDANREPIYAAENLLLKGEQVPCERTFGDGATNSAMQEYVNIPLVTSRSMEKTTPVTRSQDGKFYSDDTSIDLKCVEILKVPVKRPHQERTQVIIHFNMDKLGQITLSAEIPETGDSSTINVKFAEGYDEKKLDEMMKRTQGGFKEDYDL